MRLHALWRALLLCSAVIPLACREAENEPPLEASPADARTIHQQVQSTNQVLILGSSVNGGLQSREAQAALAADPTTQVHVVTASQWQAMTAEQFMAYRALIIGDAACQSGTAALQAAIDTRNTWGAIVDGDVVILSTDVTTNGTPRLVENAMRTVFNSVQGRTGMYIALGCAYQGASEPVAVPLLEPFGAFKVQGVPGCATSGHFFKMYPDLLSRNMTDSVLTGSGCVARSVFTNYPARNFAVAAVAVSSPERQMPGQTVFTDVLMNPEAETSFLSTPYVLVRGASTLGAGCGLTDVMANEECDLGDGMNGQPALPGQDSGETCSYSCQLHWCGDGVVDLELGEECDEGMNNGRSSDYTGTIGTCTAFCQLPRLLPPSRPPTALCQNVTVVAEYTCSLPASINNGSYDADNDLAGCTQSPAGPYGLGNTTVTLTCTDQAGQSSSCQGVVTVVDPVAPTVTLNGPASQTLACGAPYTEPGATAADACSGNLTPSITVTSNLDRNRAGQYTTTYRVADASGNVGTAVRQITVGPCATCLNIRLGEYTLFLLEDYTGGHDVEGKVAAGGNITLTDFSVGHALPDSNISNALVAGGNLSLNRGGVWGHALYGGSYSTNTSVVYPRGSAAQGRPIDFAARFAELRSLSSQLASRPANGSTRREVWGGVMMRGTHPSLNVFDVNASAFSGAVLWSIEAPAGSLVVVNIRGNPPTFNGYGIQYSGGINSRGVLFHFVDATSISAHGFGFSGTVLAPHARVSFFDGAWEGGIYALSLTGNAEGHIKPLIDRDICP
jgi:choice-of-anchor A domain-containing protein